jgi:hypothetical protein
MVYMRALVNSRFAENPSMRSYITTRHSTMGVLHRRQKRRSFRYRHRPWLSLTHSLTHSLVVPPEALVAASRLRVRGEQVVASGGPAEGLKGGTGGELIFLIKLIIKHK